MPKVKFILKGETKEVDAQNGLSILEIAHQHEFYDLEGACGGSLACATCHVVVDEKFYDLVKKLYPIKEEEEDMLDLAFGLTNTSRLACQIIMTDKLDGLIVTIPSSS